MRVIEANRDNLHEVRVVESTSPELADGEARLRIDSFALTSNNITYAVFGDAMQYWDFFPGAPDPTSDRNWGRVPVWGFADVVESAAEGLEEGRRVYGYFPMSDELIVEPGRFNEGGFTDIAAHRAPMAPVYSRYIYTETDANYSADHEGEHSVLWPLFATSYLIDDLISDRHPDANVIVSSASSKTAIGTGFCAHLRREAGADIEVVGLTSAGNVEFVTSLGCYSTVLDYDSIANVGTDTSAYVDIAGNPAVTRAAHEAAAEGLVSSLVVGGTHWDAERTATEPPPGPAPEFFFAPSQIAKRTEEWGREEFESRMGSAWIAYRDWASGWLDLRNIEGTDDTADTYLALLGGKIDPTLGYVCTLR